MILFFFSVVLLACMGVFFVEAQWWHFRCIEARQKMGS
jgi:hypothetical protein